MREFQLFLFDFDGVLVNTEPLSYQAYAAVLPRYGVDWNLTYPEFVRLVHFDFETTRAAIYAHFPKLQGIGLPWERLQAEIREQYRTVLGASATKEGGHTVDLIAGAEVLLRALEATGTKRAVVTNSPRECVEWIRARHPVLQTIPHWFTREDYSRPKPASDGYLLAIGKLAAPKELVVGFEDTWRGLKALSGTRATPVLISTLEHPNTRPLAALQFPDLAAVHRALA